MPQTGYQRVKAYRKRNADRLQAERAERQAQLRQHKAFMRTVSAGVTIDVDDTEAGRVVRWQTTATVQAMIEDYATANGLDVAGLLKLFDAEVLALYAKQTPPQRAESKAAAAMHRHRLYLASLAHDISITVTPDEHGVMVTWDMSQDTLAKLEDYATANGLSFAELRGLFNQQVLAIASTLTPEQIAASNAAAAGKVIA